MKTPRSSLTRTTLTRTTVAAFFASPLLIAIMTWLLHLVQQSLAHLSPDGRTLVPRPFGIGFVLVIALVTVWGGALPGSFALLLALASTVFFLIPTQNPWQVRNANDWVELAMIFLVGLLVIAAIEVARRTRARFAYLLGEAQQSQARLQAVMNAAPVGVLTCDANGVLNYANPETERIWGQPLAPVGRDQYAQYKILGLDGQPRLPEKRGLALVLDGHKGVVADAMLVEQPTGKHVRINAQSTRIVGENDATLGGVTVLWDTSAEHEAQEALRRSEERFRSLVEATAQINWNTQANGEITEAQTAWSAYTGQDFSEIRGWGWLRAVHPDDQEHTARAWGEAVTKKQAYQVEHRLRRHDGVYRDFLVRSVPVFNPDGSLREWVGTHSDITERKASEAALRESEERFRTTHDASPDGFMVFESARNESGSIEDFTIVYLNPVAETITGRTSDDLVGKKLLEEMPGNLESGLFARYKRVTETGQTGQWEFHYGHEGIDSWFSNTAVKIGDGFAVRFADISARKKAEAERDQLLHETKKQAERDALLNRIGQAQRLSDDPAQVQSAATSALGETLQASRCYYAVFNLARNTFRIEGGWQTDDLPPIEGDFNAGNFIADLKVLFPSEAVVVVDDIYTDARIGPDMTAGYEGLNLRAFAAAPFFDNNKLTACLLVGQANEPRTWTQNEAELISLVASQTRSAIDLALLRQRDHNIAVRLENALRPTLPDFVPGFDLAYHYQAALAESSIGGDFFDVFTLKDHVILVIGDLSGKGLAAASQIATVRNMLRFAIYQSDAIADALSGLNDAIVTHDLLTGFATLFVAAYSPATQMLYYGSCGHDPVLLRRAGSQTTELLEATGPVMGSFDGVRYEEGRTRLFPGDTLVLYTDGLSEAGRMRHEFLGTEGLVQMVENLPPGSASDWVSRIVHGVGVHAQNTFHDDQCLLVAVTLPASPEKIPALPPSSA